MCCCCRRQSAVASHAIVVAAMDLHRCGTLRRTVLYDVAEDAQGETNLKDCVTTADGKVWGGEGNRRDSRLTFCLVGPTDAVQASQRSTLMRMWRMGCGSTA